MSTPTTLTARAKRYLARSPWLPIAIGVTAVATAAVVWTWYSSTPAPESDNQSASRSNDADYTDGIPTRRKRARRTIAVVVSAEAGTTASGSILDALPRFDLDTTQLVVLIYAPRATSVTDDSANVIQPSTDIARLQTLGSTAASLVERDEMVMTFSSSAGYVHMLRHLGPSHVLLEDSHALIGAEGANVKQLTGWVGSVDIVIRNGMITETPGENIEGLGLGRVKLDELDTKWAKGIRN